MLTAQESMPLKFDENWDEPANSKANLPPEPILAPNPKRFVLFPIEYSDLWSIYKTAESRFWAAEDIPLSDDTIQDLSGKEKAFIIHAVALLSATDMMLAESIDSKLSEEVQIAEARCFFGFQMMQRNIHAELFTVILDFYCTPTERDYVFEGIQQGSGIGKKSAWLQRHITDSAEHFSVRIVALALYARLLHSSLLCCLAHLAKPAASGATKAVLPGLMRGLARLRRDNDTYSEFCAHLRRLLVNKAPVAAVHDLTKEAVAVEKAIVEDFLNICGGAINLHGQRIEAGVITQRIHFMADRALNRLGYLKLYKVEDPMPWMDSVLRDETEQETHLPKEITTRTTSSTTQQKDEAFTLDADF